VVSEDEIAEFEDEIAELKAHVEKLGRRLADLERWVDVQPVSYDQWIENVKALTNPPLFKRQS
jgi:uncharacterized coiled-coil protein SlyX